MDSKSPFLAPILHCPRCREDQHFPTVDAAASYLKISSRTIYRRIEEGKVHVVRVGGNSLRVCFASLLAFDDAEEDAPPRDAGNGDAPPSRKPRDAGDNEDPPPPKKRRAGRS